LNYGEQDTVLHIANGFRALQTEHPKSKIMKNSNSNPNLNTALLLLLIGISLIDTMRKQSNEVWTNSTNNVEYGQVASTRTNSNSNSKFDFVSKQLYEKAIAPVNGDNRNRFVLDDNWKRGNGGLDDDDRKTIGNLYYKASSVFEFGMGESTLIAATVKVPRYAGVDSDAVWVAKAREAAIANGMDHFRYYFSDIGETKYWGFPTKPELAKNEYDYQVSALMAEKQAFDVYLVDGRYRVACACLSFLHAIKHRGVDLASQVRVGIHDNDQNEKDGTYNRHYEIFQEVADAEIQNTKLWVYKLKTNRPNIEQELYDLWERIHNDNWR